MAREGKDVLGFDTNASGFCTLAVPSSNTDPVTAFDVDEESGYMITGTAGGKVYCWRLDHILSPTDTPAASEEPAPASVGVDEKTSAAAAALPSVTIDIPARGSTAAQPREDTARRGTSTTPSTPTVYAFGPTDVTSEYICRMLSKQSEEGIRNVFMKGRDVYAIVGDVHAKHWSSPLAQTFDMIRFRRQHNYSVCTSTYTMSCKDSVLLLQTGGDSHFVPLETPAEQGPGKFVLPSRTIPSYYDGKRVVWVEEKKTGEKVVGVFDVATGEQLHELTFEKKLKYYWGFHLDGDDLVYISNSNVLKVWDLTKPSKWKHKLQGHSAGVILSFCFGERKGEIITLGSDAKIKVWRDGALVRNYKKIKGEFKLGFPHLLRRYGRRVYYTADDGIYVLVL